MTKQTWIILSVTIIFILLGIVGFAFGNSDNPISLNLSKKSKEENQKLKLDLNKKEEGTTTMTNTKKQFSSPPKMQIDENKIYTAVINTDKGKITVSLNAKQTPITVNNFVALSKNDFYNDTIFHRVMKGFMIQGGDPEGTGMGGPGYKFRDEKFEGEYTRGVIAMANSGPNTNGSQFFIMHQDYALPPNYIIFGKVTGEFDAVDAIAESEVKASPRGEVSVPVTPSIIKSIEIIEN